MSLMASNSIVADHRSARFGDRRSQRRLEVVGHLWGALDVMETARVVDVSLGGVLIESPVAVPPGSEQPIQLTVDGQSILVDARVCHIRRAPVVNAGRASYLVGYEFISIPAALADALE
jgi:hypothetical protein